MGWMTSIRGYILGRYKFCVLTGLDNKREKEFIWNGKHGPASKGRLVELTVVLAVLEAIASW